MSQTFKIGDIEMEKGTKKSDVLNVAEGTLTSIEIPITIARGRELGTNLCVLAGEHGGEYAGIEACVRLSKSIDPESLRGTLIILPIVNIHAFQSRTPYVCPIDGVNWVEAWPGEKTGSISYTMAYNIFTKVVVNSNYLIDLHGGDIFESMIPCIFTPKIGNKKVDEASASLAQVFGIEYIIEQPEQRGLLTHEAAREGIPAIVAEAGHEGKMEENDVTLLYNGVINIMKHLEMIGGKPARTIKHKIFRRCTWIRADRRGLFYSNVQAGSIVSKGDILGEIRNIQGETLQKIVAPADGEILFEVNGLPFDPSLSLPPFLYMLAET